jgi:uncharacterized DUF497 family protein
MTRAIQVEELIASAAAVVKIETKHRVSLEEVEAVTFSPTAHIRRAKRGLYLVYGQTHVGRYLLVVIGLRYRQARVVTAREMTRKERSFYVRQRQRHN